MMVTSLGGFLGPLGVPKIDQKSILGPKRGARKRSNNPAIQLNNPTTHQPTDPTTQRPSNPATQQRSNPTTKQRNNTKNNIQKQHPKLPKWLENGARATQNGTRIDQKCCQHRETCAEAPKVATRWLPRPLYPESFTNF